MSGVIKSNEDLLLSSQNNEAKLDTLNTNVAKESKQDTANSALASIVINTNGLGLGTAGAGSSIAQSATSTTIIAANANRKAVIIRNDANNDLYLAHGATATTSSAVKLAKGDIYVEDKYTGIISGIWSSAGAGSARITEITA